MKLTDYLSSGITLGRADDMLSGAIDGASSYWAEIHDIQKPKDFVRNPDVHYTMLDYVYQGGSIDVYERNDWEEPEFLGIINIQSIADGIHTMLTRFPFHYGNMLNNNDDATTHDVFMQLAVMGDIVYG